MKGQVAIQFLIAVGIVLVIFVSFFIAFLVYQKDLVQSDQNYYLRDFAFWIKEEINIAIMVEDGYSRTIVVPNTINSKTFSISKNGDYLVLISEDEDFSVKLPSFTGEFKIGNNTITKQKGNITVVN